MAGESLQDLGKLQEVNGREFWMSEDLLVQQRGSRIGPFAEFGNAAKDLGDPMIQEPAEEGQKQFEEGIVRPDVSVEMIRQVTFTSAIKGGVLQYHHRPAIFSPGKNYPVFTVSIHHLKPSPSASGRGGHVDSFSLPLDRVVREVEGTCHLGRKVQMVEEIFIDRLIPWEDHPLFLTDKGGSLNHLSKFVWHRREKQYLRKGR